MDIRYNCLSCPYTKNAMACVKDLEGCCPFYASKKPQEHKSKNQLEFLLVSEQTPIQPTKKCA